MATAGGVPLFCYSREDVHTALRSNHEGKSEFDKLLCGRWEKAMANGMFRYDLSEIVTRHVPGNYGFIVQCNPKRHTHRRAPAQMSSLRQPFDPTLFNFNSIKPGEVLFELCRLPKRGGMKEEGRGEGGGKEEEKRHLMVVNVSPITYGHALFIPEPESCLPQVLTQDSIQLCLEIVALSKHSGLCIVANSLLAYASVNHLHYHILYVEERMLASRVEGTPVTESVYELTNHPSPGFGVEFTVSAQESARAIFNVINVFLEMDIPHNMVILRGRPFDRTRPDSPVIRTILIPRKAHYGGKGLTPDPPPLCAAVCELAQGFVPVLNEHKYETITEEEILDILREKMVSKENFQALLDKVKSK